VITRAPKKKPARIISYTKMKSYPLNSLKTKPKKYKKERKKKETQSNVSMLSIIK
jgi:hypothetical protein